MVTAAAANGDDEGAATSRLEITTITKSFADDQGMTEWPTLSKNSDFSSRYDAGEQLYVLEGSATLMISDFIDGIVTEELKVSRTRPLAARNATRPGGRNRRQLALAALERGDHAHACATRSVDLHASQSTHRQPLH